MFLALPRTAVSIHQQQQPLGASRSATAATGSIWFSNSSNWERLWFSCSNVHTRYILLLWSSSISHQQVVGLWAACTWAGTLLHTLISHLSHIYHRYPAVSLIVLISIYVPGIILLYVHGVYYQVFTTHGHPAHTSRRKNIQSRVPVPIPILKRTRIHREILREIQHAP